MKLNIEKYAEHPRLIDGAWGTRLEYLGLPSGMTPELWNLENPGVIENLARSYVEAGSEIIETNTFGANRYVLEKSGGADRVRELAEAGVNISRKAAHAKTKVFASIGPTGKVVMMKDIGQSEFTAAFVESAHAIADAGPDAIILETFNELAELTLALKAVRQACSLPVVASMNFTSGPDQTATMMGNTPEDLAEMAEDHGADAVGANCGIGPENYIMVVRRLNAVTELPIWVKPNAGAPEVGPDGETIFPLGPEEFADYVPEFLDAGADFIGGCCGTTPDHIRAMKKKFKA